MDTRITQLAEILVDHSVAVELGDRILICASDLSSSELVRECYRLCLERGASIEIDVTGILAHVGRSDAGGFLRTFLQHSNTSQRTKIPEIAHAKVAWATKSIRIVSLQDPNFLSDLDPDLLTKWHHTCSPIMENLTAKDWVLTKFPTEYYARDAGMAFGDYTDFYYNACIVDYRKQGECIAPLQKILDEGRRLRIIGPGTDITLGIDGRLAAGCPSGKHNIPDGECFLGPEETVTDGVATFENIQSYDGNTVEGVRLVFKQGAIVEATAERGEKFLHSLLDDHPDNRRLGEVGIGMNENITRYSCNTLFDEKIAGTIHMALGRAYKYDRGGGRNGGTIHWDLVKDLRAPGTKVLVDDQVILKDGKVVLDLPATAIVLPTQKSFVHAG